MIRTNRLPTGDGSRGGSWHVPAFRRAYYRAWRLAHPEYRERERLRMQRARSGDLVAVLPPRSLPEPAIRCACDCGCRSEVVSTCGFCRDGMHEEAS